MSLVQITRRRLTANRVPRGEQPTYETELEDHEQIVGVASEYEGDWGDRKTIDHVMTIYVAARLEGSARPSRSLLEKGP